MATVHEGKFQRALPLSYHCGHGGDGTGGLEAVGEVVGVGAHRLRRERDEVSGAATKSTEQNFDECLHVKHSSDFAL